VNEGRRLLACPAQTEYIDGQPLHEEPAGETTLNVRQPENVGVYIRDRLTCGAYQVVVHPVVGLNSHRSVMKAHLAKYATLDEEVKIFIDGGQGDGGNMLLDAGIDLFRAGMTIDGGQHLVDDLALMGDGKASLFTHLPKLAYYSLRHVLRLMRTVNACQYLPNTTGDGREPMYPGRRIGRRADPSPICAPESGIKLGTKV
jgi:hypothetical protein